ncbi:NUDIX domain protein [uncultured archaeon]|nr:NUDIX domain protein [uncultured archaeon]
MKEVTRIAAIIIQNKSLLLVKGADKYKEYWTPGGKVKEGESDLDCLQRELSEEINVKVVSSKFFGEYVSPSAYDAGVIYRSRAYLAEIEGKIVPGNEIKGFVWMSRKEFDSNKYPLIPATRDRLVPDLIKKGLF